MTIAPLPSTTQSVAVTGPAESVSVGALQIYGANGYSASLALTKSGSLTATSVGVLAGGSLADSSSGSGALITPSLTIAGGKRQLGQRLDQRRQPRRSTRAAR